MASATVARRGAVARRTHETLGLLLRRVPYGESDLIVSLLTEGLGAISALARGARRSQRSGLGTLEPMHTLRLRLEERSHRELLTLREAAIESPRCQLVGDLDRMQAAGRALVWIRRATPPRTPEPEVWTVISQLLDQLDDPNPSASPALHLAECGLALLTALGWGIDFERCVVSGARCAPGRAAMVDATRGGLVSRAHGGARVLLDGARRERFRRAAGCQAGALLPSDAQTALALVEEALRAHVRSGP